MASLINYDDVAGFKSTVYICCHLASPSAIHGVSPERTLKCFASSEFDATFIHDRSLKSGAFTFSPDYELELEGGEGKVKHRSRLIMQEISRFLMEANNLHVYFPLFD